MAKIIALSGDVGWEITANDIRAELKAANGEDVEFHINSPGGFVSEGIEIFNLIRAYSGNTLAVITGLAASMGSYIILAADKVVAFDNAIFMIHNAWGCVCGDHNDMNQRAKILEGMSDILARAYAKKTGKDLAAVKALMDADTFFFGEEIKTEGFADEIIDAADNSDDDKASAIIKARLTMDACLDRISQSKAANDDLQKAVAYFEGISALTEPTQKSKPLPVAIKKDKQETPAVAGTKTQEVVIMTLAEFFAANPSEKITYDAAIATAHSDGRTVATDEMKAVIAKVSPILTSAAYGTDVKESGIKAIIGDGPIATFETLVVLADRDIEKAKAADAAEETEETEETPGGTAGEDAEAQAAFAEKVARTKAGG